MCDFEQIKPMITSEFRTTLRRTSQSRKALTLALEYLERPGLELKNEAIIEAGRLYKRSRSNSPEDSTIGSALEVILQLQVTPLTVPLLLEGPSVRRRFVALSSAWTNWAAGQDPSKVLSSSPTKSEEFGGALQWMSLDPWEEAIRALTANDLLEAKRLFRRSVQLGTQCQTESNPVVQWAYAATFFHS